jgi:hypothetical protein
LKLRANRGNATRLLSAAAGNSEIDENSSNSAMSQHGGGTIDSEFHGEVEGCLLTKRFNFHE